MARATHSGREAVVGGGGFVVWLTGLSGAGKTTVTRLVEHELALRGQAVEVLDGERARATISPELGFSKRDRDLHVGRLGRAAAQSVQDGVGVLVAAISPYRETRRQARKLIEEHAPFVEVFVDAPLDVCAARDVKGLYERAFAGAIEEFTGVSAPYEAPEAPDLVMRTSVELPGESALRLLALLEERGLAPSGSRPRATSPR